MLRIESTYRKRKGLYSTEKLHFDSEAVAVPHLPQGNQTITGTLEIDTSSVDTAVAGINATTPEMLVTAGLDSSEVDNYDPENLERTVTFKRSSSAVDSYISYLKNLNLNKTVTITYRSVGSPTGTSRATGTAHARGTAMLRGYWGARDSGVALGGELGQELVVRDGSFFTIGDDSAEMFRYKKGDIIFNAEQTRQILQNGRIASGGKRGYAYACDDDNRVHIRCRRT